MRTITPLTLRLLNAKEQDTLLHLIERRRKSLQLIPPSAESEAEHQALIDPTWRTFLMLYGRTTPPGTPALRPAEAFVLTKVSRSTLMKHLASFTVMACWRLRMGQPELAQSAVNGAAALLKDHGQWLSAERRESGEAIVRRMQNQVRMAQGLFPLFPWKLKDFIDEMAVPLTDLPHLVLTYCWMAYRFGAEAEAMAMAEKLRLAIGRAGDIEDDLILLHMEAWILANKAIVPATGRGPGARDAGGASLSG